MLMLNVHSYRRSNCKSSRRDRTMLMLNYRTTVSLPAAVFRRDRTMLMLNTTSSWPSVYWTTKERPYNVNA